MPKDAMCPMFIALVDRPDGVVLQGEVINLTVTGVDLDGADNVSLGEIGLGAPADARRDRFRMAITIPHGTALGAKTLRFTTHGGQKWYESPALVTVTPINVAEHGSDSAAGTARSPFATLARALVSAGAGDTVVLGPGTFGEQRDPSSPLKLPSSLTLEGAGKDMTRLSDALVSAGDLTLQALTLDQALRINGEGSRTNLSAVSADGANVGFLVSEQAIGSTLVIGGATTINSSAGAAVESRGDRSTLRVIEHSTIANLHDENGQAIRLTGNGQVLEINGSTINSVGPDAVTSTGKIDAWVQDSSIQGLLGLMGLGSTAMVETTRFQISPAANAAGGISFIGAHLDVRDCSFQVVGLFQDSEDAGVVTVRGTKFEEYREPPVVLQRGTLDLGTATDPGRNQFKPVEQPGEPPVALQVKAEPGTASVSCSMTTFSGDMPPAASVMGPAHSRGMYEIDQMVPITFY
ncbi:MAG TPA: DUF1565 domain-containing protein [Polyangia bacterium]|nr:DUF1565 domain-containing protein [Polyangia bacterium]